MATIKSYTDIEQSKKLAEILPIESADNLIVSIGYNDGVKTVTMPKATLDIIKTPFSDIRKTIPCWSLSALLNVLPVSCDDEQHCLALINHNPNEKTEWLCAYEDDKGNLMMECYADNQIDACVAMIEKLHEQNLL